MDKRCDILGCSEKEMVQGLCRKHYIMYKNMQIKNDIKYYKFLTDYAEMKNDINNEDNINLNDYEVIAKIIKGHKGDTYE